MELLLGKNLRQQRGVSSVIAIAAAEALLTDQKRGSLGLHNL